MLIEFPVFALNEDYVKVLSKVVQQRLDGVKEMCRERVNQRQKEQIEKINQRLNTIQPSARTSHHEKLSLIKPPLIARTSVHSTHTKLIPKTISGTINESAAKSTDTIHTIPESETTNL